MRSRKSGTADGNDPCWVHGKKVVSGPKKATYVRCNYCSKIVSGGINRLKHHLAKTSKDTKPCAKVPNDIYIELKELLAFDARQKEIKRQDSEFLVNRGSYYRGSVDEEMGSIPTATDAHGPRSTTSTPSIGRGSHSLSDGLVRGPMDRFVVDTDDYTNPTRPTQEMRADTFNAKEHRNQVCLDIGRFFFENGISFNVASSSSFANMLLSVSKYAAHNNGRCVKPPSAYELSTWILKKEVESTNAIVEVVKKTWPRTGVTIMSDGWKDMRGRQLINFLVNNPDGTVFLKSVDASDIVKDANALFQLLDEVVEEVGEENVIQVVTDNASNYKAAGNKLMEKRKHLYWTPCAAHCIDLMLGDLFALPTLANAYRKAKRVSNYIYNHGWVLALMRTYTGRDLVRPAPARFGTGCLTLASIKKNKLKLEEMFTSPKWGRSSYAKQAEGKVVKKIICRDNNFWPGVTYSLKATEPLFHVWRIVDSETVPAMGFLYDAMDKAKKEIALSLNNELAMYKEIWDIIDKRWDNQLQKDLHAAGHYLNPRMEYDVFSDLFEVKRGLYNCMDKLLSVEDRDIVHSQLDHYLQKGGLFGRPEAIKSRHTCTPSGWWRAFGDSVPELKKFAIKVLNLTCSSSACERNWSTFNHVHTKKRNRLATTKLNALVYVMYNKKLHAKKLMMGGQVKVNEDAPFPLDSDAVDSDNKWLVDPDPEVEPSNGGNGDVGNPPEPPHPQGLVVSNPCPEAQWYQNLDELDINAIRLDGDDSRKNNQSKKSNAHGCSTSEKGKAPMDLRDEEEEEDLHLLLERDNEIAEGYDPSSSDDEMEDED